MWSRGKNITIEILSTTLIIACVFCLTTGNAAGMTVSACNALVDDIVAKRRALQLALGSVTEHQGLFSEAMIYTDKYGLDDEGFNKRIQDMVSFQSVIHDLRAQIARLRTEIVQMEDRWDTICRRKWFRKALPRE